MCHPRTASELGRRRTGWARAPVHSSHTDDSDWARAHWHCRPDAVRIVTPSQALPGTPGRSRTPEPQRAPGWRLSSLPDWLCNASPGPNSPRSRHRESDNISVAQAAAGAQVTCIATTQCFDRVHPGPASVTANNHVAQPQQHWAVGKNFRAKCESPASAMPLPVSGQSLPRSPRSRAARRFRTARSCAASRGPLPPAALPPLTLGRRGYRRTPPKTENRASRQEG